MSSRNDQNLQSQTSSHKRCKTSLAYVNSDAIESVISFLPIKDATKLSILSKRFRHSWKFCRNLCFDRSVYERMSKDEFKALLNNFFQYYKSHKADKFSLCFDPTNDIQQMIQWIKQALALGITELELNLSPSSNNNIIFSINYDIIGRVVEKLKLVNCEIQFPVTTNNSHVNGYFYNLREVIFQNTSILQASLELVLLSCPSLTSLEMISCSFVWSNLIISAYTLKGFKKLVVNECLGLDSMSIYAPLLSSFHYHGKMIEFQFLNRVLTRLNDAVFDIVPSRSFVLLPRRNHVMVWLAFVRILSISSTFLEGFSSRFEENIDQLETRIWLFKLKEFNLDVSAESFITPKDIVEFLRKCREIEKLKIVVANNSFKNSVYWDVHGRRYMNETTLNLPYLKAIKIKGFTYNELHVTMARFFLKNIKQLEDLTLVKAKYHNLPEEFTQTSLRQGLTSFSSHAVNVQFMDYQRDTNEE